MAKTSRYSMNPGSGVGGTGNVGTGKIFSALQRLNLTQGAVPPMIVKQPVKDVTRMPVKPKTPPKSTPIKGTPIPETSTIKGGPVKKMA